MSYDSVHVCNSILEKSFQEKIYINTTKLNALLYMIACDYKHRTGFDAINEEFYASKHIPYASSIEWYFCPLGENVIDDYRKDIMGKVYVLDEKNSRGIYRSIDRIWSEYKYASDQELQRLVTSEGTAYWCARNQDDKYKTIITPEMIKNDHQSLSSMDVASLLP